MANAAVSDSTPSSKAWLEPALLRKLALPLTILAALLPLLFLYITWSWRDGHYQYIPLLIASIVVLLRSRSSEAVAAATEPRSIFVVIGLTVIAVLAFVGHVLSSGFIGIIAASCAIVVLIYASVGQGDCATMGNLRSLVRRRFEALFEEQLGDASPA
ncbi:MAG: hypothetical protein AAF670_15005, partial [Planctomycetota bacterium]